MSGMQDKTSDGNFARININIENAVFNFFDSPRNATTTIQHVNDASTDPPNVPTGANVENGMGKNVRFAPTSTPKSPPPPYDSNMN